MAMAMTRRAFLAAAVAAAAAGMASPRAAAAYPWVEHEVDGGLFLDSMPVTVVPSLCSALPDSVTWDGGRDVSRASYRDGILVGAPARTQPDGLVVKAVYGRIGLHDDGSPVGCEVTCSNMKLGSDESLDRLERVGNLAPLAGIEFYNFDDHTSTLFMRGVESVDVEQRFFYAETGRTISAEGAAVTLSSLDCYIWNGVKLHEGCQLPDGVKDVYTSKDAFVAIDKTAVGRYRYDHCCYGDAAAEYDWSDGAYDAEDFQKHGVSWVCPAESVRYKFVSTVAASAGFNISLNPVANATPAPPLKRQEVIA